MAGNTTILIHAPRERGGKRRAVDDSKRRDDNGSLTLHAPASSPIDEVIQVRVTGANPGARVTLESTLVDDDGVEWSSRATFEADAEGTVDLRKHAPTDGDWAGARAMGWCWAMTSHGDTETAALGGEPAVDVTVEATTEGGATATRRVSRQVFDESVDVTSVDADFDDHHLIGTLYEPAGEGPHPGVVSLHGGGGRQGTDRTEKLLATRGFATLALAYVGEHDALPDRLARVPVTYPGAAVDWLRTRPTVAGGPVGLFGVSRGAELALEVGARHDDVGAVVSYAGSGVRYDTPDGTPAWVDADGEALPHLTAVGDPEIGPDGVPISRPILERGFEEATDADRAAATIPVERIDGPVLLVSGGDDQVWPADRLSAVAAERLEAAASADHGRDAPHAHLTDAHVGHLVGVPHVPLAAFDRGGGTPGASADLGADAWQQTLEYLERGVRERQGD